MKDRKDFEACVFAKSEVLRKQAKRRRKTVTAWASALCLLLVVSTVALPYLAQGGATAADAAFGSNGIGFFPEAKGEAACDPASPDGQDGNAFRADAETSTYHGAIGGDGSSDAGVAVEAPPQTSAAVTTCVPQTSVLTAVSEPAPLCEP